MPKNSLVAMMARPAFNDHDSVRQFLRTAEVGTPILFNGQPFVVINIPERSDLSRFSEKEVEAYRKARASGPAPKTIMPVGNMQ